MEGYFLPSEADLLVVLLVHNIVGKGRIQEKHLAAVDRLVERVERDELRTAVNDRGTLDALLSATSAVW